MTDQERINHGDYDMPDTQLPEFDIDLRQRLVDHEIIDRGHTLQFDLDKLVITPDKFDEVWEKVARSIEILDNEAAKAGLQGLKAGVRGYNISLPHIDTDFANGTMLIGPMSGEALRDELAKQSTEANEIRGRFAGYSLRFRRNQELPGTYIPQLVYQISMKQVVRQCGYMMPMANGDVGISQLFFEADERIDFRKDILERLFSMAGEYGPQVSDVNHTLASADFFDAEVLRKVGVASDELVCLFAETSQKSIEDTLCELIENYIDISLRNFVVAESPMRQRLGSTIQPIEYTEGPYESRVSPSGVEFFDWPNQGIDGTFGSIRRCCLVSEQDNVLIVMPLGSIERFE